MLSQEPLSLSELARRELMRDPAQSNAEVAEATGASRATVRRVRYLLARAGLIAGRAGRAPMPAIPALPVRPELTGALCATGEHDPGLWTSLAAADRAQAIAICWRCPVLDPCRRWALALPTSDSAIWGAMTTSQRIAARRGLAAAG